MAELLRGELAHVNLIPMNAVAHTPWTGTPIPVIERFAERLRAAGIADDDPVQPGHGDRGRLRPARRGARRPADARSSSAAARAARRRERRGPARRAQRPSPSPAGVGEALSRWAEPAPRRRPDRGQHPRRRPGRPGRRDPAGGDGGRGPDPPRRHGRPLRPQPHLRRRRRSRRSAGVTELPFDAHLMIAEPGRWTWTSSSTPAATRSRSTSRSTRRRSRPTLERIRDGRPVGRAVGQAGDAAGGAGRPTASCSTSSW